MFGFNRYKKIRDRLTVLEDRVAHMQHPFKFEIGDKVWVQDDVDDSDVYQGIVVDREWELVRRFPGVIPVLRENTYLILDGNESLRWGEQYLSKTKPKQPK